MNLRSAADDPLLAWMHTTGAACWLLNPGDAVPFWAMNLPRSYSRAEVRELTERVADPSLADLAMLVTFSPDGQMMVGVGGFDLGTHLWCRDSHAGLVQMTELEAIFRRTPRADVVALRTVRLLRSDLVDQVFIERARRLLREVDDAWQSDAMLEEEERRHLSLLTLCRLMLFACVQRLMLRRRGPFPPTHDALAPAMQQALRAVQHGDVPRDTPWDVQDEEGPTALRGGLVHRDPLEVRAAAAPLEDGLWRRLCRLVDDVGLGGAAVREDSRWFMHPRLVGRTFESLMHPQRRRQSATYYTPAALADHLGRTVVGHWLGEPPTDAAGWHRRWQRIRDVRVLDPACGSGAVLLAVLEALVDAGVEAAYHCGAPESAGTLRRHILTTGLFGIDVSPSALMVCELRLWLALMMDPTSLSSAVHSLGHLLREADALQVPEVPPPGHGDPWLTQLTTQQQLVRQALCLGHPASRASLVGAMQRIELDLATAGVTRHLVRLRDEHAAWVGQQDLALGGESVRRRRHGDALASRIAGLETRLRQLQSGEHRIGLDPSVHFADVFQRGGFDLIVGNPPWMRLSELPESERRDRRRDWSWLASGAGGSWRASQPDLSVAFVQLGAQWLHGEGVAGWVLPLRIWSAGYGEVMRSSLLREHVLLQVEDLSLDPDAHFDADALPSLLVHRRRRDGGEAPVLRIRPAWSRVASPVQPAMLDGLPEGVFPLLDQGSLALLQRVLASGESGPVPRLGCKTGSNTLFCVAEPERVPPSVREVLVPLVRGRDLTPMQAQEGAGWMVWTHDRQTGAPLSSLPLGVQRWLGASRRALESRADWKPGMPWWRVFRVDAETLGWRVVWSDVARNLGAGWVAPLAEGGAVHLNSTYAMAACSEDEAQCMAAWLNALPSRWVAAVLADAAQGGYRRFQAANVGAIRWPVGWRENGWDPAWRAVVSAWIRDPASADLRRRADILAARMLGLTGMEFGVLSRSAWQLGVAADPLREPFSAMSS